MPETISSNLNQSNQTSEPKQFNPDNTITVELNDGSFQSMTESQADAYLQELENQRNERSDALLPKNMDRDIELSDGTVVKASAVEVEKNWEDQARQANEQRGLIKKNFGIGIQTPMSIARSEAISVDKELTLVRETMEAKEVEKDLTSSFEYVIKRCPELRSLIRNHGFDGIISEDDSGRFPAEIMYRAVNKIYASRGEPHLNFIPLRLSRGSTSTDYELGKQRRSKNILSLVDAFRSGVVTKGILYVSDIMSTGGTIKEAADQVIEARSIAKREFGYAGDFSFSFLVLDTAKTEYSLRQDGLIPKEFRAEGEPSVIEVTSKSGRDSLRMNYFPAAGRSMFLSELSGLKEDLSTAWHVVREEMIKRIGDRVVSLYEFIEKTNSK